MLDLTRPAAGSALGKSRRLATPRAPVTSGLVAGTQVETETGWCGVETLRIGDRVQTLDGGLARILGLDRRPLLPETEMALILLPGGRYDACDDLLLVPGQHLLLDAAQDDEAGAPWCMMPALALTIDPQVRRQVPARTVEIVTPLFADEEVVYANSGALLHCPGITDGAGHFPDDSFFRRLDMTEARDFLLRRAGRLAA